MQSRKHTAWKKNRKFGDVYGGRTFPKLVDKVFNRQHNLKAPGPGEAKPLFITDNPSRDFFFPVTVDEIKAVLEKLPAEHTEHLTHIWLQKIKKSDYLDGETFQASFICGSGVYLIVLHPFPVDLKMRLGKTKPLRRNLNYYKKHAPVLHRDELGWYLQWTEESIKQYYLNTLLLFEIGQSIESFHKRFRSKASKSKSESFAENYAVIWADKARETHTSPE